MDHADAPTPELLAQKRAHIINALFDAIGPLVDDVAKQKHGAKTGANALNDARPAETWAVLKLRALAETLAAVASVAPDNRQS